jgi:hypothetical protein
VREEERATAVSDYPAVRIPPDFLDPLQAVAGMTGSQFKDLIEALSSPVEDYLDRAVCSAAIEAATEWDAQMCRQLVRMLTSLASARQQLGLEDTDAVARAIAVASKAPDESGREELSRRIVTLWETPTLELLRRAQDLMGEHEHLLAEVRIISDLRPMFVPGTDDEIDGAVVGHGLRLRLAGAEPRTINIALDATDLISLERLIQRASKKDAKLRALAGVLGVPVVMPFEELGD